jgi:hypothetical protein
MQQNKLLKLKVVCIFLFCISFSIAALIILALIKSYLSSYNYSYLDTMTIIFLIGFILIGTFQLKCYNLVANKYPDKKLSDANDTVFNLLTIFSSIVFLAIFFCFLAFVFTTFLNKEPSNNSYVLYGIIIIFAIYIPSHVYCMRQSFALRRIIKINYYESQNNMIETIGQKNEDIV